MPEGRLDRRLGVPVSELPSFTMPNDDFVRHARPIQEKAKPGECCNGAYNGWGYTKCRNRAKVVVNGHGFCGIHDPVKVKAKRDARNAAWDAEWKAKQERYTREERVDKAERKVLDLAKAVFEQKATFDDLEIAVRELRAAEAS